MTTRLIRWTVARYGTAADREPLRNDPNVWVRWVVEYYGRND